MKIALIGYGKMGKAVEEAVFQSAHKIISISYKDHKTFDTKGIKEADVAIDFTSPEIVLDNAQKILSSGINFVIGTTGWYKNIEEIEKMVKKYKKGVIYGSNFSIGANIFFQIVANAAKLLGQFDYDVAGFEVHHTGKKDSPSGTAKKISDIIIKNMPGKKRLQAETLQRQITKEELHFASVRTGRYFGRHEIFFDSVADEIKLTHDAHNRLGFAKGAVYAAEFIKGKRGLYSFEDVFAREVKK